MTYRERQAAKAERLRQWADGRETKADAAYDGVQQIVERIPFGQPILVGHHSERGARADQRRIQSGMDRFCEHSAKADQMRSRADNIEKAAKRAIYSDDADALDQLRAKLERLEAQREAMKTRNADWLKLHRAELKGLSAYERDRARPHQGYELQNLGGVISTTRKRIAELEQLAAVKASGVRTGGRVMTARYGGECADCGGQVERGETITWHRATRELVCSGCTHGDREVA